MPTTFKLIFLCLVALYTNSVFSQETENEYGYPIDKSNGKVCFTNNISVNETKAALFRRTEQFLISQNFDRAENIRCKDKSHVEVQIVSKPITYKDSVDGVYIGNGFFNFEYRGHERFVVTFNYKIAVKDQGYSYKVTNLKVLEFVTAPKNKGKSRGFVSAANNSTAFGGSSGFVEFSANDVRKFDFEEFIEKKKYDNSHEGFIASINEFKHQLKTILTGGL